LLLELGWPVVSSESHKLKAMIKNTILNLAQFIELLFHHAAKHNIFAFALHCQQTSTPQT